MESKGQMPRKKEKALQSPWVLFWIAMFVVFVSANMVMIFLATDRPGLVAEDYYDRGQDYEENMIKRRNRRPDWKMEIHPPGKVFLNKLAFFEFTVTDAEGNPPALDQVIFRVYRPSSSKYDFELPMEQTGEGRYQVNATFPLPGVWDILVSTVTGEDEWNTAHQLFVAKPESDSVSKETR